MKTYSEFLLQASTIVEGASIIKVGKKNKVSYRGPTGDHKRDKYGHIVASHYKKTKTVLLDPPPKKGKKKKGPINWQKTKKNKQKIKQSKQPKQKLPWQPKTPEERQEILKKWDKVGIKSGKKQRGKPSPRYKTTDYKNLRPASERMGKKKVNEDKKYPYGKATKKNPRGKRDQAELDRAQAYIKKNPNFGKKKLKEDAPTMSVGTGGFSGSADEKGPVAGYDPLLKMMNRWKKAKTYPNKMADVVNRGKNGR